MARSGGSGGGTGPYIHAPKTGDRPDLGDYKKNYLRDQVMELYNYSRNEHEQRYCTDWFYYYKRYKNYIDRRISPDDYRSNIGVNLGFPIIEMRGDEEQVFSFGVSIGF